jgi:hypothetical protein
MLVALSVLMLAGILKGRSSMDSCLPPLISHACGYPILPHEQHPATLHLMPQAAANRRKESQSAATVVLSRKDKQRQDRKKTGY